MENVNIKTAHGHLFTCNRCNKIHFEFNQIAIDFSSIKTLESFLNYLKNIDYEEFEKINNNTHYIRKIHIPFPNTSIKMVLSQIDLKEITMLTSMFIKNYKMVENEEQMIKKLVEISERQLN